MKYGLNTELAIIGATCLAMVVCGEGKAMDWKVAASAPRAMPKGEVVFRDHCLACHGEGMDRPGTVALATKYGRALPAELQKRTDLTPEYVTYIVRHGVMTMPPFRKTELSEGELTALDRYICQGD